MELKEIKNIKYFAKGKRSRVYTGFFKKKKVSVKVSYQAEKEGKWLKFLNKYKIGPKLLFYNRKFIVYEFIEGERILDYLKRNKNVKWVLKRVLLKCRKMDKLKINKKEMGNPYKHILIKNRKVKMIDFERCYKVKKAKNVTQFCQFLMGWKVSRILKDKKIKINKDKLRNLLRKYKKGASEKNFKKILNVFGI